MSTGRPPTDSRWPGLMSFSAHEFRTHLTVAAGYTRMLLKGSAGPLTDQQLRLLQEVQKATARISALVDEMSDIAKLETGAAAMKRGPVDLGALLEETIAALPPLQDRVVTITLQNEAAGATVTGDIVRLKAAFAAILTALRRELVETPGLQVRIRHVAHDGSGALRVAIADDQHIDEVDRSAAAQLDRFNEFRGGCGLSLAVARGVVSAHNGLLFSPSDGPRAGAIVILPEL